MFCLLIAVIARLRRSFGIISRNSRFRGINSRLGLQKFPVRLLREFGRKRLILLAVLGTKLALSEENAKIPGFTGKTGNGVVRKCAAVRRRSTWPAGGGRRSPRSIARGRAGLLRRA